MHHKSLFSINNKVQYLEYFVVFILIFYAGKANKFVGAIDSWEDPVGLMLPIVSVAALAIVRGVQLNYKYWLFIIGFSFYFLASTIKFSELHPRFFLIIIINFTIAYIIVSGLRYRFFRLYEEIIFYLCLVALAFWTMINLFPSFFIEFLRNFEFSNQGDGGGNVDFNTIIFTVNDYVTTPDRIINIGGTSLYRNAGFAWEPGAFAIYINIAIFFNLMRNKFTIKNNKHLWVFIPALATTFSTTGYSIFILLILFYLFNKNALKITLLIPFTTFITIIIFTLPFMMNKVIDNLEYDTETMLYNSAKYDNHYSPQRFQSLQIDVIDFLNNPLIGYGGHEEERWTNQLGAKISTASGIGEIMAQYGIAGIIFVLISLWKSSGKYMLLYDIKGRFFPFIMILFISVSYSIMTSFFMCIWLLHLTDMHKTKIVSNAMLKRIEMINPVRLGLNQIKNLKR
ncbi:MAG: hypothetical protein PHN68_09445 [Prolixibacteraceae bacterium]|nr:hypothetical protein [Prolixibacteraceae bacterium]